LQLERQHHVLERVQVAEQLEALEHEAELLGADRGTRVLVDGEQVDAGQAHRAFARRIEPGDDRQQRALARSRRADDRHRALRHQGEFDVVENRQGAGRVLHALGQMLDGDDGLRHGSVEGLLVMSRRRWLAHCSAALAALSASALMPSFDAMAAKAQTILVVGDSLSAEYGLQRGSGWVALMSDRMSREHPGAVVVNASISGDTTAGGLARLPALLRQHRPSLVILELGGNDALRGLPIDTTRSNLVEMARLAKAVGAKVVILGMQLPPNYGRSYGERFAALFAEVAKSQGTALVPFMLKGVADIPQSEAMFQADRIHPLASAHPIILGNVWPVLEPLLK
jgi:acyl-CoA thioesterase-1